VPPGKRTHITHSQNAIRKRKNMTLPVFPGGLFAAFELNIADLPEAGVGDAEKLLNKFNESFHQI